MSETYSIGATNITSLVTSLQTLDPVVIPPPVQDDYVVPGLDGAVAANAWFGAPTWSIGAVIVGTGNDDATRRADAITKLQALATAVFASGGAITITRVIGAATSTASARYLAWNVNWEAPHVARVAVDFRLMDGGFKSGGSYVL
jgi:hypothetical protein